MSVSQRRYVDLLLVTPDGKLQSQNTMGLKAVSMIVNSYKNIKKQNKKNNTHTHKWVQSSVKMVDTFVVLLHV